MESQRHTIVKTISNNNNNDSDNNKTARAVSLKLYYRFILVLISISNEEILLKRISYWGEGVYSISPISGNKTDSQQKLEKEFKNVHHTFI